MWSLRADAGVVTYGGESRRAALSESVGDRVQVDVETSNYIVPLTIGTQLEWPERVQLDLGVQYVAGGRTSYLTTGSIVDVPGGAISVTPVESVTHMVVVRLGARITR